MRFSLARLAVLSGA